MSRKRNSYIQISGAEVTWKADQQVLEYLHYYRSNMLIVKPE